MLDQLTRPLLVCRSDIRRLLGCSNAKIVQLENRGLLSRADKMGTAKGQKAFYRYSDLLALIENGDL